MEYIQEMELNPNFKPSRTQRRVTQMRDAILNVAQAMLVEGGASGLSCEQVAAAADVSIQTVYNRVGRKDDLLMALAERAVEESHRYMDSAYAQGRSARQQMEAALDGYIRFAFERPEAFLILAQPPQPVASPRLAELLNGQCGRLAAAIQAGQAEGEVDPELDPRGCATALWALWNGILTAALQQKRYGLEQAEIDQALTITKLIIDRGLTAWRRG